MALPNAKSPWRRVKKCGTAARTNATRKPAGKRKQQCIATGGDNSVMEKAVMQVSLETKPFAALETDALVTYIFEENDPIQGRVSEIDSATNGLLKKIASSGEVTGKTLEFTLIHAPAGLKATRLLLVGAGKRDQFSSATLRKVAGAAVRYLKSRSVKNFAFLVREDAATAGNAQAIAEGFITANFETDKYKTEKKNGKDIESVRIAGYADAEKAAGEKGLLAGTVIAQAQNFARDLVNEPSN